ncbi:MAG: hypothetical protein ACJ72N_24980 [Labedaea sp.]
MTCPTSRNNQLGPRLLRPETAGWSGDTEGQGQLDLHVATGELTRSTNPIIDDDIVYALVLIAHAALYAGRYWGPGRALGPVGHRAPRPLADLTAHRTW